MRVEPVVVSVQYEVVVNVGVGTSITRVLVPSVPVVRERASSGLSPIRSGSMSRRWDLNNDSIRSRTSGSGLRGEGVTPGGGSRGGTLWNLDHKSISAICSGSDESGTSSSLSPVRSGSECWGWNLNHKSVGAICASSDESRASSGLSPIRSGSMSRRWNLNNDSVRSRTSGSGLRGEGVTPGGGSRGGTLWNLDHKSVGAICAGSDESGTSGSLSPVRKW
ncbi:hypothetical protein PUMCH_005172 [Australozyma saopauloensis]|uniref:Uncharacterized protein n=1 Tax=Australozyma saopauloensis TaxID=291208 RepID=A0AAX4HH90_9ASCO|nr:hypothetical protein PUMCH_005172 [[Candida] saopauloensis]